MAEPKRIQLSRRKGYRKPEEAIVVARPSRWGNPYVVGSEGVAYHGAMLGPGVGYYDSEDVRGCDIDMPAPHDRLTVEQAVALYRQDLLGEMEYPSSPERAVDLEAALESLRGHDLACWCQLDQPCHADVLLELANR